MSPRASAQTALLLRALHADASAWEMVSFDEQRAAPIFYPVPVGAV